MQAQSFTFKVAPDLLTALNNKAQNYSLSLEQVVRNLVMAWYYDLVSLPNIRDITPAARGSKTEEQVTAPRRALASLYGDFWPEDESIDDFIATVRQWRQETD